MSQSESKSWMLAWFLFTAMPLVGAAGAYRHQAVASASDEASASIALCPDVRPARWRAVEQGDRGRRRPYAERRARDGALAILFMMAQGPRTVALR